MFNPSKKINGHRASLAQIAQDSTPKTASWSLVKAWHMQEANRKKSAINLSATRIFGRVPHSGHTLDGLKSPANAGVNHLPTGAGFALPQYLAKGRHRCPKRDPHAPKNEWLSGCELPGLPLEAPGPTSGGPFGLRTTAASAPGRRGKGSARANLRLGLGKLLKASCYLVTWRLPACLTRCFQFPLLTWATCPRNVALGHWYLSKWDSFFRTPPTGTH